MEAFLKEGFHAATPHLLEQALDSTWDEITAHYGDKEGLFFAATERRLVLLAASDAPAQDEAASILAMLRRISGAVSNPRLRAQHHPALERLQELAQAIVDRPL
jgi:AcrR family transcriptional regulator